MNHPNTVTWGDYARAVENYNAEREKADALGAEVERLQRERDQYELFFEKAEERAVDFSKMLRDMETQLQSWQLTADVDYLLGLRKALEHYANDDNWKLIVRRYLFLIAGDPTVVAKTALASASLFCASDIDTEREAKTDE